MRQLRTLSRSLLIAAAVVTFVPQPSSADEGGVIYMWLAQPGQPDAEAF